jgi:hypothetical protein
MRRSNFDKEWKTDEATLKIVKRDRSIIYVAIDDRSSRRPVMNLSSGQ